MQSGKAGMGLSKHRTAGVSPKSPRARAHQQITADRDSIEETERKRKRRRIADPKESVRDLLKPC